MAKKPTLPKHGYSGINYDIETRILRFTATGGKGGVAFIGVPAEVFYGMPTGYNVQNFIDLKLRGRYTMIQIKPPPVVAYSHMNKEWTVYHETEKWIYKQRPGWPTNTSDSDEEANYARFLALAADLAPDVRIPISPTLDPETVAFEMQTRAKTTAPTADELNLEEAGEPGE